MMNTTASAPTRPIAASRVTLYVGSTLALCAMAVVFIIAITVVRPEADNSALITTVLGILTPVVGALLAGALKEVHTDVNSRLTEFLALTEKAAKAEGRLEGAPVVPVPVIIETPAVLVEKLDKIEQATVETAKNTAATIKNTDAIAQNTAISKPTEGKHK